MFEHIPPIEKKLPKTPLDIFGIVVFVIVAALALWAVSALVYHTMFADQTREPWETPRKATAYCGDKEIRLTQYQARKGWVTEDGDVFININCQYILHHPQNKEDF